MNESNSMCENVTFEAKSKPSSIEVASFGLQECSPCPQNSEAVFQEDDERTPKTEEKKSRFDLSNF